MGRRFKIWLAASLLVLVVGFVALLGMLAGRSRGAYRIVMERWEQTVGSPDELFARFPAHETNTAARDLLERTQPLGIDLGPRDEDGLPRPSRAQIKRLKFLLAGTAGWLKSQLSKPSGPPDPPPESLLKYLGEFRETIDQIEIQLVDGAVPTWSSDMKRLHNAPFPNLNGHLNLNKLLVMDYLAAVHGGDTERARRALDAAWQLDRMLGDEPLLITQLTRLNLIRTQAAAVRFQPQLDHWIPRLDGRRYRERLEQALLLEGWIWPQWDLLGQSEDVTDRIRAAVVGPYLRLGTVDASERWRRTMLRLQETDAWCAPGLRQAGLRLRIPMPWWNRIGTMLVTDVESTVLRLARVQLQMELSRRLLEIDAERRRTGGWPVVDGGAWPSESCPGDRWEYEVRDDVATLRLSREPETEETRQFPASWEFSLQPSAVR